MVAGRSSHPIFKAPRIGLQMLLDSRGCWLTRRRPAGSGWRPRSPRAGCRRDGADRSQLDPVAAPADRRHQSLELRSRHTIATERKARLREVQPSLLMPWSLRQIAGRPRLRHDVLCEATRWREAARMPTCADEVQSPKACNRWPQAIRPTRPQYPGAPFWAPFTISAAHRLGRCRPASPHREGAQNRRPIFTSH